MCGRYAATAHPDELVEDYEISFVTDDGAAACEPRYNIAPTDTVPAVVERLSDDEAVRKLVGLRWGLVPSWSKNPSGGARMINARVETVSSKPAFRKAFAARRCILPSAGYYEWRPEPEGGKQVKQPYFIRPEAPGTVGMAGIYEFWRGPDGWLATASVITTSATDATGWIHDRMPMTVLDLDAWLDPAATDPEQALGLLVPLPGVVPRKVSRAVNKVGTEGPELITPID